LVICAFSHRGIEIDYVQPFIFFESLQQAEDVGDSQFTPASVHQLDRLTAL
jgi:hypothetical protein